jgi:hypothetical protein
LAPLSHSILTGGPSLSNATERDIIGGDRQAHRRFRSLRVRDGRYAANDFECALVAIFEV